MRPFQIEMAVGKTEVETVANYNAPVLVSGDNEEQIFVSKDNGQLPATHPESLSQDNLVNSIGQSVKKSRMDKQDFVYPLDLDAHFMKIFKRGPKFLQSYADRTTHQDGFHNEFGSQAKKNLPDYYYKNSGDPSSNRWLRSRAGNGRCSRPHSRVSSADSSRSRPASRQGPTSQLPGMENPKCFASESNNFEILTPLESMSMSYKNTAGSEHSLKKHGLFQRLPGIRSVRFGQVQGDSTKGYNGFTSTPQTPLAGSGQRRVTSVKTSRPTSSSSRPQSW